jgi:hypothetical protein
MSATSWPLRVCSYEDRAIAMDSLILMAESLCAVDRNISLHLTVPQAPQSVLAWAERWPQVVISTTRPDKVTGWDVKPWLLLQELNAGSQQVVWLDTDMIVTRPISTMLQEFLPDSLIVAEEWDASEAPPYHQFWGYPFGRRIPSINACVLRVTPTHRPLLQSYLQMTQDQRYRHVQALPIAQRPFVLLGDSPLLIALLESKDFAGVSFDCLRMGRHIAQCAGSSGYRPHHRILDLFRGLPPLIHGLGRKPWDYSPEQTGLPRFLLDLATDVSPYVLAAQKAARDIGMTPDWLETRTWLGGLFRRSTANHPGLAGLPLAIVHALHMSFVQMMGTIKPAPATEYEAKATPD